MATGAPAAGGTSKPAAWDSDALNRNVASAHRNDPIWVECFAKFWLMISLLGESELCQQPPAAHERRMNGARGMIATTRGTIITTSSATTDPWPTSWPNCLQ